MKRPGIWRRAAQAGSLSLVVFIISEGCGSSSSPTEPSMPTITQTTTVSFTYAAPTDIDPDVDYPNCSPNGVVFTTHLHFIWNGWNDRRYMNIAGPNLFEFTAQVPINEDLQTALHDPNTCLDGDVYVAPTNLLANGVRLDRVVSVVDGTGVAFRVAADGTVIP